MKTYLHIGMVIQNIRMTICVTITLELSIDNIMVYNNNNNLFL